MEVSRILVEKPFFSICIPQYNRTSFLIEACKVLASQTFKNFEVCISDDRSNDGREQELIDYLQNSGFSFVYQRQEKNLRYDGNIRASIALARGRYCLLHGNDDCLASTTTLDLLYEEIEKYDSVGVVIPNFEDWSTRQVTRRIRKSDLIGSGPEIAATHFRNVAFVTGVILDRVQAQSHSTDKWDGSEMYQMFIMARILASGSSLLELDISAVRKDIQITNESVDSYAAKPKLNPCPIVERKLPFMHIGRLIADAIAPYLTPANKSKIIEKIFLQLYLFTYPFWIIEYRRVQSWNYAIGICLGIKPKNVFFELDFGILRKIRLCILYFAICLFGLSIPVGFFEKIKPFVYSISKSLFFKINTRYSS
ncbi:family 2 glycosyl transferase [Scytonema hofmannii PCC 7110]|uniref:Family 2 glycosyl transferase n=1 Tax=Scytonema hofmannii PCC 7110 TaxID=128403 RepID=A0A139WWQ1_9CYAN|nr:glycosyltransferase family 2 protein [Scytonema hofmannii]KYC36864.1 family 2 glycosyl transferase [Scytonema hofmannii PCC 7110]